ncbi:hypothetical protein SAY86_003222 [Trapa natans]|uniref:NAC domain-containing protein n=1 Tax=Trapa natans TaxID=22666 RepID=A0AAN7RHQ5_TRANT|nr:hypothetical protein SAY86_003222 [Trapa natans]
MSHEGNNRDDDHEHDMVMPGFRFHPTEEELVEFYLRRKVEGKRFNVELITFLDLYRYDPWELPGIHDPRKLSPRPFHSGLIQRLQLNHARFNLTLCYLRIYIQRYCFLYAALAAIGEKEWFFYAPRDRKYRNGDRPNRVTTSGYWKATGADRMIRAENSRPIGLKKTLVFYSGKAPKGIRTCWIMNEYRLPQHETERYQKVEISLCRVYKRPGMEDHAALPRSSSSAGARLSSSSSRASPSASGSKKHYNIAIMERRLQLAYNNSHANDSTGTSIEKINETDCSCSSSDVSIALGLSRHDGTAYCPLVEVNNGIPLIHPQPPKTTTLPPAASSSSSGCTLVPFPVDELHSVVNYQQPPPEQIVVPHQFYGHQSAGPSHLMMISPSQLSNNKATAAIVGPVQTVTSFSDRLWDWNPTLEADRPSPDQFGIHFK